MQSHVISLSIWLPILAGVLVLLVGSDKNALLTRSVALAGSIVAFFATLPLYTHFNFADGGFQLQEMASWIPAFNVHHNIVNPSLASYRRAFFNGFWISLRAGPV